ALAAGGGADRRAERRALDGLLVLRSRGRRPLARHLYDPRPYRTRPAHGPALRLSRLLGQRLAQDGLQGALPAAGAADAGRLDAGRNLTNSQYRQSERAPTTVAFLL